jgi:hypothetical protein
LLIHAKTNVNNYLPNRKFEYKLSATSHDPESLQFSHPNDAVITSHHIGPATYGQRNYQDI